MKILVIDDNLDTILVLLFHLKRRKHQVTECSDPLKALQLIEANEYDLIITDYSMTELTGIELAINVRNNLNEPISEIPIILLTGCEELELIDAARDADVDLLKTKTDVLTNPSGIDGVIEDAIRFNTLNKAKNQLIIAYKQGKK
jgi:CheY-like chemotaxis protein